MKVPFKLLSEGQLKNVQYIAWGQLSVIKEKIIVVWKAVLSS